MNASPAILQIIEDLIQTIQHALVVMDIIVIISNAY